MVQIHYTLVLASVAPKHTCALQAAQLHIAAQLPPKRTHYTQGYDQQDLPIVYVLCLTAFCIDNENTVQYLSYVAVGAQLSADGRTDGRGRRRTETDTVLG